MIENPMFLVRDLRSCELKAYLVILLAGQAVNQKFVQRWSGYTDKPVASALAMLEERGLIQRHGRGWAPGRSAEQLPLGIGVIGESRKLSDSPSTTTTALIADEESGKSSSSKDETRKHSDSRGLLAVLYDEGISEPTASRLAVLSHMTRQYVRMHVGALRKGQTVGLAIRRMEHGEPPPPGSERHLSDDDRGRRYVDGKFAEFIEH